MNDFFTILLNGIIANVFRNPPVLLGLIAGLGLVLQKKSFADTVKGMFLAAIGMLILQLGVDVLVQAILPVNIAFQGLNLAEETQAVGMTSEQFTANFGGVVGSAMFLGFIIHLLIARFTPVKTIFLTGHFLWWFPYIFVAIGVGVGMDGVSLVIFGALFSAIYWSFVPWIMRPFVKNVIGDNSFTLGHPSAGLSIVSGLVARVVGNKEKSTESLKFPPSLSFFREVSITGSISVFIVYIVVGFSIGFEGKNIFFYSLEQGLKFGAGLVIMLQGVRMLINQIVPAFKGISEKLVPNAVPAFDCPILFNYKPNAALIGFIVAMVVSTALILVFNSMNLFGVLLIPLVITSFFECGTAAVIGEGEGGVRGAIIGSAVAGAVMVLLLGFSLVFYKATIMDWMLIFGGNDLSLWGIISGFIGSLIP